MLGDVHIILNKGPPAQVVMNSKQQGDYGEEIITPLPAFEEGKLFKVEIICREHEFEILVDGIVSISNVGHLPTGITRL